MSFFDSIVQGHEVGLDLPDLLTGGPSVRAADRAANLQHEAALAGMDLQRETTGLIRGDLQPYREAGLQPLSQLLNLSTAEGQSDFIQNNPFFDALAEDSQRRLFANQAARGKLGSGETADALQRSIFGLGSALLQDERNQLMQLASLGENAAAMSGNQSQTGTGSIIDLLTGSANARGAAGIAGANAQQQATSNTAGMVVSLLGSFFSDIRLKENIKYIDDRYGFGWYGWTWNDKAKSLVGDQPQEGPIAQEILAVRPDLISSKDGYLIVNMEELKNAH